MREINRFSPKSLIAAIEKILRREVDRSEWVAFRGGGLSGFVADEEGGFFVRGEESQRSGGCAMTRREAEEGRHSE